MIVAIVFLLLLKEGWERRRKNVCSISSMSVDHPTSACLLASSVVIPMTIDGWLVDYLFAIMGLFWCRRLILLEVDSMVRNSEECILD